MSEKCARNYINDNILFDYRYTKDFTHQYTPTIELADCWRQKKTRL